MPRPVGRQNNTQIGLRLKPEFFARIEAWRFAQRVPPSRSAAVVYLLDLGLKTAGEPEEPAKPRRRPATQNPA
jgi:hypothetical protein